MTESSTADQLVGFNTVNANHCVILVFECHLCHTIDSIVHFIATGAALTIAVATATVRCAPGF